MVIVLEKNQSVFSYFQACSLQSSLLLYFDETYFQQLFEPQKDWFVKKAFPFMDQCLC